MDKIIFRLLLAFLMISPTIAVFVNASPAGAGVLAAVGAAAILLTRLADISTFELSPLKVKLERQAQQVEVTLQQLQKMATAFAQASLTELGMSGHLLVHIKTRAKFEIHDRIINSLKEMKISDEEISKAQAVWITLHCRMILDSIEGIVARLRPDVVNAADEMEGLPKESGRGLPLPEAVRNWIASRSLNDVQLFQLIDEYDKVWTTGTMKNPELIPSDQTFTRL
jgi:hypothetical protein